LIVSKNNRRYAYAQVIQQMIFKDVSVKKEIMYQTVFVMLENQVSIRLRNVNTISCVKLN
jgi:hypothetical protein